MTEIERNCLVEFFNSINEKFEYVVLRNANELPYENFSNDIDILIREEDYKNFQESMFKILTKNNFARVERTSFHGIECYTFYNLDSEIHSLKIDLFFNVQGGGVKYYDFETIIEYKKLTINNIYVLEEHIENFLTALKTLAAGGKLKEKYLQNFISNSIDKNHILYKTIKSETLKNYLLNIKQSKENLIKIDRKIILKEVRKNNLKNSIKNTLRNHIQHFSFELARIYKHNFKFVFVGPDGSGKTTLIEKLKNESYIKTRAKKERFIVLHHRPHLFPMISELFNKKNKDNSEYDHVHNPHSGKSSNKIVSFLKMIYYTFDYLIGNIIKVLPLYRQGKFVIFDRYFYDFIVDQKRSAISIPKNLAILIYKILIPKPKRVYFIKVDPILAHERKKELSVDAIKIINDEYTLLTDKLDNFKIIENKNLDTAYDELLRDFIKQTTVEIKG